jgi:hypothetical protein
MANVKKKDRVQDADIRRLNHLGFGLKAIAEHLGCHPATIKQRLQAMNTETTDTRRSFMEQVFNRLTPDQQEWLSHNLYNTGLNVKDFIVGLIQEAYDETASRISTSAPTPTPTAATLAAAATITTTVTVAPVLMPELEGGAGAGSLSFGFDEKAEAALLHPTPDELTPGTYEIGGASEHPDPSATVEPEKLTETAEELPPDALLPKKNVFR